MEEQNSHITDYLTRYITQESIDFAVMIEGPWGCGKTHFFRNFEEKQLTEKAEKSSNKPQSVYISLNGVSKTSEIDQSIYTVLHPVLGSKKAIAFKKFAQVALKAGLRYDYDANGDGRSDGSINLGLSAADIEKVSTKAKNVVFVFDDLERCLLPIEATLAYINEFVERASTPVIVIGDESRFANKDFEKLKEKVVGKTFRVEPTLKADYKEITAVVTDSKVTEIIERNQTQVEQMFAIVHQDTKEYNYRALRHSLRDFEFFFSKIDSEFHSNQALLDEIFRVHLALSYEHKLNHFDVAEFEEGNLSKQKSETLGNIFLGSPKKIESEKRTPLLTVLLRHELAMGWPHSLALTLIFEGQVWLKILSFERVDSDEVTQAFHNSRYCQESAPAWKHLWEWRRLEDEEAVKAYEEVLVEVQNFEYKTIQEIFHTFLIFHGLADLGVIDKNHDQIAQEAVEYASEVARRKELIVGEIGLRSRQWYDVSYGGLGYWGEDTEERRKLYELLNPIYEKSCEDSLKIKAAALIATASEYPGELYPILSERGEFYYQPFFHKVSADDFFEEFKKVPNKHLYAICKLLTQRLELNTDLFAVERLFYESFLDLISKYNTEQEGPTTPKRELFEYLEEMIRETLEKLTPQAPK